MKLTKQDIIWSILLISMIFIIWYTDGLGNVLACLTGIVLGLLVKLIITGVK